MTREMVAAMQPGSAIVDIAAERGGNCELTVPGETVNFQGVAVMGPLNVPSMVPFTPARCSARTSRPFVKLLFKDGALALNREDEIIRESLVTCEGRSFIRACLKW